MTLPTIRDKHLIEMPGVAKPAPSMPQFVCKRLTKLQTPQAHRLIANGDSALGQQLLDITETQTEPMVEPHGIRNNLRRKSVATIV